MVDGSPLDREEFQRWRLEADQALAGARLQGQAGLHNWACFAAEQAAQLALKGFLHGMGLGPWGHLVQLGQRVHEAGLQVPRRIEDSLRRLGRHYIPARYPDAHASGPPSSHYGATDFDEALRDVETILAFVDELWKSLK